MSTQPVVTIHEIFLKSQAKEPSRTLIPSPKALIGVEMQTPLGRGNISKS